jgi:hypothetical protein
MKLIALAALALASPAWAGGLFDADDAVAPASNRFPNFIGWMSNPSKNNDPRSLTQVWPIFGAASVSGSRSLTELDMQVYGAGLNIAITDCLSIGFNNGAYAHASISRDPGRLALIDAARANVGLPPTQNRGGPRDGFLDLGGFVQYILYGNVEKQFLLTAGFNWMAPTGSTEIFQGRGPLHIAPYLTAGKELGNFHVLATAGYQFPVGSGNDVSRVYYANAHLDYQLCDWIYPLVEVNWSQAEKSVGADLATRRGYINLGNFETTANVLSLASGFNFVIVRDKLELGAVYVFPVNASPRIYFNEVIARMTYRF